MTRRNQKENIPRPTKVVGGAVVKNSQYSTIRSLNMGTVSDNIIYDAKRDYTHVLGYLPVLTYTNYMNMIERNPIAKRIIGAPVDTTWADTPFVTATGEESGSKLQEALSKLNKQYDIYTTIMSADKLQRIGTYSILYLGFTGKLDKPITNRDNFVSIQAFNCENAVIAEYDTDIRSPRYGLPVYYDIATLDLDTEGATSTQRITSKVHYSRVIHLTEDPLENKLESTPVLAPVFNTLMDIMKVSGSSAEMFYLGARPGYVVNLDSDAELTEESADSLERQLTDFLNDIDRVLRVQGAEVKALSPQVTSPSEHIDTYITLLAGTEGIPQRILKGNEAGELASSQDETTWNKSIQERRTKYAEPNILAPLLNVLMFTGHLPVVDNYTVIWGELHSVSAMDKATIIQKKATAISQFMNSGAFYLLGPETTSEILYFTPEQAARTKKRFKELESKGVFDSMLEQGGSDSGGASAADSTPGEGME